MKQLRYISIILFTFFALNEVIGQDKPAAQPPATPQAAPQANNPPADPPKTPAQTSTPTPAQTGGTTTQQPAETKAISPASSSSSSYPYTNTSSSGSNNYYSGHSYTKSYLDTVERFAADPTPLKIVYWNEPSTGKIGMIDTSLGSIRPSLTASINENVLVDLNSWMQEGKQYNVPFEMKDKSNVELLRYFDLPAINAKEKLYLYFEGIAWKVEIKLNGKFVGTACRPFDTWYIPINPEWLRDKSNLLEISLNVNNKTSFELYPRPFLGIFRPCYLVTEQQLKLLQETHLKSINSTPLTVAMVAPYYLNTFIFDKANAIRSLIHLKKQNIHYIHFVYPADKELKELCALMDFTEVKTVTLEQPVCWLNAYPYETASFPFSEQFWLLPNDHRTMHYSSIYKYNPNEVRPIVTHNQLLYVLLVLFPLIGMFLIKLLNPGFFHDLQEVFVRPRLQLDSFIDATTGNRGLFWILLILRVIFLSIFLTLCIHYVQSYNQWHLLQTFNEHGLLKLIFYPKTGMLQYFIKSLMLIGAWTGIRLFLVRFFAGPFRIHNMYEGVVNLELISAYPMLFLLPLPLIFMNHLGYQWHSLFWWIQGLLVLLYIGRQIYIYYTGMDRLFKLSNSVRIMYIMVFVLLPYIVCL